METGDTNEILESYSFHAQWFPNEMIPILCGNDISFCYFFAVRVVRGHFGVKLKMCGHQFHIFGQID